MSHLAIGCDSCPRELGGQSRDPGVSGSDGSADILLGQEAVLERLDEVEVLDPALGAGHGLTVVGEEVDPLVWMDHQVATRVAFESLCAAGHRGKDVVAVHGAEDQLGAVPDLGA